jgi:hypothetical protein
VLPVLKSKNKNTMKQLFSIMFVAATLGAAAQRNRAPQMAPVYAKGYYVNFKNDTLRGDVQVNPADDTEFHDKFAFRQGGEGRKPRIINGQKAKAYGFNGRHFVVMPVDDKKIFLERLVSGRLRFYELKYHGKKDGYPAIVSDYFIKDTGAEEPDADLRNFKQIPDKFYKKALKPYMKDQPMIWSDLDKYNFNEDVIVKALKEFNEYYKPTGN